MSELQERVPKTLTVREDQMLFAIPLDRDGIEEVLYTTDEPDSAISGNRTDREHIKLAGVWSHLDWDEAEKRLAEIDDDSRATPPITDLL